MILPGRLSTTTLGDLFGMLHRAELSGTLELTEDSGPVAGRVHRLEFARGLIRGIESSLGAPPLGELLVNDGLLSRAQHLELLARLNETSNKTTGQWLYEFHWLATEAVGRAVHEQLNMRMVALFSLREARVTYRISRAARSPFAHTALTPEEFLHGKPRYRERSEQRDPQQQRSVPHYDLLGRDTTRTHALLLLGLTPQSTPGDIKKAFHRMAARLHPDRHQLELPHQQEAARMRFIQVVNAYNTLMGLDSEGVTRRGAA